MHGRISARADRDENRMAIQRERQENAEQDRALDELDTIARMLSRAALLVAGARTPKGQWRRKWRNG